MKKRFLPIFLGLTLALNVGCTSSKEQVNQTETTQTNEQITIDLGITKGAPSLPIIQMLETNAMGDDVTLNLEYWNSPEQLIAMTQDENYDIFTMPLTVAAKLYNKGVGVKLTNVNTWGIVHFLTTDNNLTSWSDLKGKTIYVPQKSSPADIVTQFFLKENGLTVGEDVNILYSTPGEITQLLIAGKAEYAVSLEPQVTNALKANENIKIAFSYDSEWKKLMQNDTSICNAGIVSTTEFIKNHSDIMDKFEVEYEKALNYLLENPEKAGELGEKYLGLNKEVVIESLPRLGLAYKNAKDSKESLDVFYKLLLEFDETTIGGKVPDEGFYYIK